MPVAAAPVLEAEAYDVDPAKTGMTPRDFLLYCYYGGLIHIGVRQPQSSVTLYWSCYRGRICHGVENQCRPRCRRCTLGSSLLVQHTPSMIGL